MAQVRLQPHPDDRWAAKVRSDPVFQVLIETLYDHENRIRLLEGKAPISRQQALDAFKTRLQGR